MADRTLAAWMSRTNQRLTRLERKLIRLFARQAVPAGMVSQFDGITVPDGYLLCNGQAVSRTTYAALFAAIGTLHGAGNGTTTFNVPDRRGRVGVGVDPGSAEFGTVGQKFGTKTVTLTTAQMPGHTHDGSTNNAGNHAHGIGGLGRYMTTNRTTDFSPRLAPTTVDGSAVVPAYGGNGLQTVGSESANASAGSHSHTITANSTGGGGSHNNIQPSIATLYVIKT